VGDPEVPRPEHEEHDEHPADEPHEAEGAPRIAQADQPGEEWYIRPWRERVQAADVAIAGLVLVVALVGGLAFFLTGSSTVPGGGHLAVGVSTSPSRPASSSHSSAASSATDPPTSSSLPVETTTPPTAPGTVPAAAGGSPGSVVTQTSVPAQLSSASGASRSVAAAHVPACTPGNLAVSTTTDASEYSFGSAVTITTRLVAQSSCVYDPVASGPYSCPTTVVVVSQVGSQVYPYPAQSEQCAQVDSGTLASGEALTVTVVWSQAPLGQYSAVGTWSWGADSNPCQLSATSAPFEVLPVAGTP